MPLGLKLLFFILAVVLFLVGMILGLSNGLTPHAQAVCLYGGLASFVLGHFVP